jgi:hypothetical protein
LLPQSTTFAIFVPFVHDINNIIKSRSFKRYSGRNLTMIISFKSLVVMATTASVFLVGAAIAQDSVGGSDWKLDLDRANTLLAQGKYSDAISLYDDVIRAHIYKSG